MGWSLTDRAGHAHLLVAGRYADVCQYTGVVCITMREYYCAEVPAFSYTVCRSIGCLAYRRIRMPMSCHTGVPMYGCGVNHYTGVRICSCTGIRIRSMPECWKSGVPAYSYTDVVQTGIPVYVQCTGVPVNQYPSVQLYPCTVQRCCTIPA